MQLVNTFVILVINLLLVSYISAGNDRPPIQRSVRCKYDGKSYFGGQDIPIPDDPCLHCTCTRGWTKPSEFTCARIDCPFAAYEDCEAVYSDDKCCPTWNCPPVASSHKKQHKL